MLNRARSEGAFHSCSRTFARGTWRMVLPRRRRSEMGREPVDIRLATIRVQYRRTSPYSLFGLIGAPEPVDIFPIRSSITAHHCVHITCPFDTAHSPWLSRSLCIGCRRWSWSGRGCEAFPGPPCAWDVFVGKCKGHMVAVTLHIRDSYVGLAMPANHGRKG